MHGRGYLVDVLPARSGGAYEILLNLLFINNDIIRYAYHLEVPTLDLRIQGVECNIYAFRYTFRGFVSAARIGIRRTFNGRVNRESRTIYETSSATD